MKPRSIKTLQEFTATDPPPEGGRYVSLPLNHDAPMGLKFTGYRYARYSIHADPHECLLDASHARNCQATEVRKYHDHQEIEWRPLTPIQEPPHPRRRHTP